ncbi:hypothetical protein [Natrinema gelatinilyticum]|uniref:hypothetical protein n=1 Tax=Natrinema gelatinilyticum TaxID=2961571 RepID=UPI0020C551EA|nr:hypothetical protein [Natrinema gelatinilyticum]
MVIVSAVAFMIHLFVTITTVDSSDDLADVAIRWVLGVCVRDCRLTVFEFVRVGALGIEIDHDHRRVGPVAAYPANLLLIHFSVKKGMNPEKMAVDMVT